MHTVFLRRYPLCAFDSSGVRLYPALSVAFVRPGYQQGTADQTRFFHRIHCEFPDGPPALFGQVTSARLTKPGLLERILRKLFGYTPPAAKHNVTFPVYTLVGERAPEPDLEVCPEAFAKTNVEAITATVLGLTPPPPPPIVSE